MRAALRITRRGVPEQRARGAPAEACNRGVATETQSARKCRARSREDPDRCNENDPPRVGPPGNLLSAGGCPAGIGTRPSRTRAPFMVMLVHHYGARPAQDRGDTIALPWLDGRGRRRQREG